MNLIILRETDAAAAVTDRTLSIRVATYGRVYEIAKVGNRIIREKVRAGAFAEPIKRPMTLLRFRHNGEREGERDTLDDCYGICTALRDRDGALIADFEVFEGQREDKLLALVNSGALKGASMTAHITKREKVHDPAGPLTEILEVSALPAVSLTPAPAYDDAQVISREAVAERRAAELAELTRLRTLLTHANQHTDR